MMSIPTPSTNEADGTHLLVPSASPHLPRSLPMSLTHPAITPSNAAGSLSSSWGQQMETLASDLNLALDESQKNHRRRRAQKRRANPPCELAMHLQSYSFSLFLIWILTRIKPMQYKLINAFQANWLYLMWNHNLPTLTVSGSNHYC